MLVGARPAHGPIERTDTEIGTEIVSIVIHMGVHYAALESDPV
jgi:hypothetical protein